MRSAHPRSAGAHQPWAAIAALLALTIGCGAAGLAPGDPGSRVPMTSPGVVFVPTPPDVGFEMLKLAGVTSNDVVYDLGSGDGRLVIAAAQLFGARAVGVELDAKLVQDSREAAAQAGVAGRVTFVWGDLFRWTCDRPPPSCSTSPRHESAAAPAIALRVEAGDSGGVTYVRHGRVGSRSIRPRLLRRRHPRLLNLWIIPARVQGTWAITVTMPDGELSATAILEQNFQRLTGLLRTPTDVMPIVETSLRGDVIAFSATLNMKPGPRTVRFRGLVAGDSAAGTAEVTGGLAIDPGRWTARRRRIWGAPGAPRAPHRSSRPGEPGALLDPTRELGGRGAAPSPGARACGGFGGAGSSRSNEASTYNPSSTHVVHSAGTWPTLTRCPKRTSGVRRSRGSSTARSTRRSGESPATRSPSSRKRGLSRFTSAPAPRRSLNRRNSPGEAGRSARSTKCTSMRRSAKKRCALRVSASLRKPKIWTVTRRARAIRSRRAPHDAIGDRGRSGQVEAARLRSVKVGAARGHEIVLAAQIEVGRPLSGGMLRVVALDPHEAPRDQVRDQLVLAADPGVGHDGHAAGPADDLHSLERREPLARHVGRTPGVEVAVERLAHGFHVASGYHHLGDVRAPRRSLLHDGEDLAGVDGHAQLAEARRDAIDAGRALGPLGLKKS